MLEFWSTGSSNKNSSTPHRASVSQSRMHDLSVVPTTLSNASPMPWPSVSLIFLKRSMSIIRMARRAPLPPGLREPVCEAFVEQKPIWERRQMVCPHEIVQPLFHPSTIAYIARDAENLLRGFADGAFHQPQCFFE